LKAKRARYQQGSIRKIARASGFAWEVRFSETVNGTRKRKTLIFDSAEYPTEKAVRKAIQTQVALVNSESDRAKVAAKFGAITALYRVEHLPTLKHSTRSTNEYLLRDYIEPQWSEMPLQDVTPRRVLAWFGELGELAATTKAAIRSILSQCFHLAALHGLPYHSTSPFAGSPLNSPLNFTQANDNLPLISATLQLQIHENKVVSAGGAMVFSTSSAAFGVFKWEPQATQ
jgi:hypothetical protein